MKKFFCKVVLLSVVMAGALGVKAQNKVKLSLDAGKTYSVLKANTSNLVDNSYKGKYGFGINLSGEYTIWNTLFVSLGVSYLEKNYEWYRTGPRAGSYDNYTNDFIAMPLMIGGYMFNNPRQSNGFWAKFAGGMYTEYWLSRKTDGRYPVFSNLQTDGSFTMERLKSNYDFKSNENKYNRFGYGVQGVGQLGYSLKNFDVYASYTYQYGLSDIQKKNKNKDAEMTMNTSMITLGLSYKFK